MDVCKTMCFIGEDAFPTLIDTIWHRGSWWLVSTWLKHPDTGHRIPERIVQMDGMQLRFQEVSGQPYRFLASNSVPKDVLAGSLHTEYVVDIHPMAVEHTHRHDPTV